MLGSAAEKLTYKVKNMKRYKDSLYKKVRRGRDKEKHKSPKSKK